MLQLGKKSLFFRTESMSLYNKGFSLWVLSAGSVLRSTVELNSCISQCTAEPCTSAWQRAVWRVTPTTTAVHTKHQRAYQTLVKPDFVLTAGSLAKEDLEGFLFSHVSQKDPWQRHAIPHLSIASTNWQKASHKTPDTLEKQTPATSRSPEFL